jgi:hypothetical protein
MNHNSHNITIDQGFSSFYQGIFQFNIALTAWNPYDRLGTAATGNALVKFRTAWSVSSWENG